MGIIIWVILILIIASISLYLVIVKNKNLKETIKDKENDIIIKGFEISSLNKKNISKNDIIQYKTQQNIILENKIKEKDKLVQLNNDWYLKQLQNLAHYLKITYNDDYLNKQLLIVGVAQTEKEQKQKLNINNILDKINDSGFDSLSTDELDFLNNNKSD